jgi:phage FluMu protein Com
MAKKPEYDIRDIRCTGCGRFLGKGQIKSGVVIIFCSKCKEFTATMGVADEKNLTSKVLDDIIANR